MRVEHVVTRPLITLPSGSTILQAAKLMVKESIGLLVIRDPLDETKVAGVISERDIINSIALGESPATEVDRISTKNVITVNAASDVAEAAKAMNRHHIRHVVVLDDHGKVMGVVSMRDLVGERSTLTAILQSHEKEIFTSGD